MKLGISTLFGAALLCLAAHGQAQAPGRKLVAVAVYSAGQVTVKSPELPARPLKVGEDLYLGDAVETGPDGQASVAVVYGAEVRLNSGSLLEFSPGPKGGFVKLDPGQVWTRLLHRKARLEIRTPAAICGIRGTEADIEQRERLTVKVYEGHVDVSNKSGRVGLKAGQISRVAAGAAPSPAEKLKAGEESKWQEGLTAEDIEERFRKLVTDAGGDLRSLEFGVKSGGEERRLKATLKKKEGGK